MKFVWAIVIAAAALGQTGEQVYRQSCAQCHDGAVERAPGRTILALMYRESIVKSLASGLMVEQGRSLSSESREAVAAYLTGRAAKDNESFLATGACAAGSAPKPNGSWTRWGGDLANSRMQSGRDAGIAAADVPKLKLAWAVGLPGEAAARSQPAVTEGRLFVGSGAGVVLALDARSGCRYWSFTADYGIRSGVVAAGSAIYFTDMFTNVYALDAKSGAQIWKTKIGEHPVAISTGTPQFHEGVLYTGISSAEEMTARDPKYPCCTFRGSIVAIDSATGKIRWRTHTVPEPKPTRKSTAGTQLHGPSGAGVWTTPTIDAKLGVLYAATGDNFSDPPTNTSDAVLALDLKTGRIVWSRQMTANDAYNSACSVPGAPNCPDANGPDYDFGQPPILVSLAGGRRALVIGQKSGMVHALDPDHQGEILWQKRVAKGSVLGGIQWGSASDGEKMYVAIGDYGIKGRAPGGGLLPDPERGGGLAALRLRDGETAWLAKPGVCGDRPKCSPAQSAAVTAIPGAIFSGSLDGRIRAYSTADGHVLWEFDTVREFDTVNGVKARGGAIDAHGPVVAGGFVYTGSGYGSWGTLPGNVILAFSTAGK